MNLEGYLTAVEAHKRACDTCETREREQLEQILEKIETCSDNGLIELECYCTINANVKFDLEELGYKLTKLSSVTEDEQWKIEW